MKKLFYLLIVLNFCFASEFDYKLKPIKLSDNSYYFYGKEEYFSNKNGGNIANTAFIVTPKSVIVLDTGSSYLYGKQVIEQIKKITNKPIKYVINTHHHPDHFLGNNAFKDATILSTEFTAEEIKTNGDLYIQNLVNLIQEPMNNTKVKNVNKFLTKKIISFDGYKLHFYYLNGHTQDDVVIFDENTKILYISDLIFNHRALATPHSNINKWIETLKKAQNIDYKICVPGHGVAFKDKKPFIENIKYLQFLNDRLEYGLKNGLDIYEILEMEVPADIKSFSMFDEEFERSIINLYNKRESIANKKLY